MDTVWLVTKSEDDYDSGALATHVARVCRSDGAAYAFLAQAAAEERETIADAECEDEDCRGECPHLDLSERVVHDRVAGTLQVFEPDQASLLRSYAIERHPLAD